MSGMWLDRWRDLGVALLGDMGLGWLWLWLCVWMGAGH